MVAVVLEGVTSAVLDGRRVIDGLDLLVGSGEILTVLGPSGSGKSTLLRLIAGLARVESGSIRIGGRDVTTAPPGDRGIAMVPQADALLPHLDVEGNLGFGLRLRRVPSAEVSRRVHSEARVIGLADLLTRPPETLSGGARRATAVGRATVRAPALYLLDEPLARLDTRERARIRTELVRVFRRSGATTLLVTNDPAEAMSVGDRLAVLVDGRIVQVGPPQSVYEQPATVTVAQLVGDPGMAVLAGTLEPGRETTWVRIGPRSVRVPPPPGEVRRRYEGRAVLLGLRPEHVRLGPEAQDGLAGTVERVEPLGPHSLVHVAVDGCPFPLLLARSDPARTPPAGARVLAVVDPAGAALFDPVTEAALPRA